MVGKNEKHLVRTGFDGKTEYDEWELHPKGSNGDACKLFDKMSEPVSPGRVISSDSVGMSRTKELKKSDFISFVFDQGGKNQKKDGDLDEFFLWFDNIVAYLMQFKSLMQIILMSSDSNGWKGIDLLQYGQVMRLVLAAIGVFEVMTQSELIQFEAFALIVFDPEGEREWVQCLYIVLNPSQWKYKEINAEAVKISPHQWNHRGVFHCCRLGDFLKCSLTLVDSRVCATDLHHGYYLSEACYMNVIIGYQLNLLGNVMSIIDGSARAEIDGGSGFGLSNLYSLLSEMGADIYRCFQFIGIPEGACLCSMC